MRASRFAAQYYNAKVAVIELPFGFVSSESIGGKDQQHRVQVNCCTMAYSNRLCALISPISHVKGKQFGGSCISIC